MADEGSSFSLAALPLVTVLIKVLTSRDWYLAGHAWRTSRYMRAMAQEIGWRNVVMPAVECGGLLHDLGLVAVPDHVLHKSGPLTNDEQTLIQRHPVTGTAILRVAQGLETLVPYVATHHERWDGKGYPDGLEGFEIPVQGRLAAVACAFDDLTVSHSYVPGIPVNDALETLQRGSGYEWDPAMVKALTLAWEDGLLDQALAVSQSGWPVERRMFAKLNPDNFDDAVVDEGALYHLQCKGGVWVIEAPAMRVDR